MKVDQGTIYQEYPAYRHQSGRELIPFRAPQVPATTDNNASKEITNVKRTAFGGLVTNLDIRNASPRQISEISIDLYAGGIISWQEYAMLAFQPETQPGFDATIGALTGEKAEPDRQRDYIAIWQDRLAFERKHNSADSKLINRTERITNVLRQIEKPTNMVI